MPYIDISSVSILIVFIHIIQVAALLVQFLLNRDYKGMGWWLLWGVSIVTGFIFLHLRYIEWFTPYAIFLQNSFLILGLIFLYVGIMRFLERKENALILYSAYGVFEILLIYFIHFEDSVHIRSLLFASVLLLISAATAYALFRYRFREIVFSANTMGIVICAHGGFYLIRLIYLFSNPSSGSYMSHDWNTVLMYIIGMVVGLYFTFSLIFMVNQKLNSDMKTAKEHFETIFSTSPDAVIITRLKDGKIINVNNAFCSTTGYTREETIGNIATDFSLWKNPEDRDKLLKELILKGISENHEYEFTTKDSSIIHGLMSSSILKLKEGPHIVSVIRDISTRIIAEKELRQKNQELEAANSEKDKLFSIISHDLKNSFNIFLGYTDLLFEDIDKLNRQEINSMARNMNASARNLYKLLENLLEWSVFKRGLTRENPESISVYRLTEEITEHIRSQAVEKGITLELKIPHDIFIMADKWMAGVIFRNLLSNSVKFTRRNGRVIISSSRINSDTISITVNDTGIGMSEEIRNNLFNIGKDTKRRGTDNEPSTGLGLVLVKEYVTRLGGTITVESEEGKGSSITVTLPAS